MKETARFDSLDTVRLPQKRLHLAVGMFDGVHRGHQAVIDAAISAARAEEGLAGVLTFWPHPSELFRPDEPTPQIMTAEMKEKVLVTRNIDFVIMQPFTREFASVEAVDFLPFLQQRLPGLAAIYVGRNWRFGRGRRGDVPLLCAEGNKRGVAVVGLERLQFEGEPISSTRIRACIAAGEIETANSLLGYPYFSEGEPREGRGLGRQIGFPTLNVPWEPPLRPKFGVYVVRVQKPKTPAFFPSVANYGVRPTVTDESRPLLEAHLLGEDCPFTTGDTLRIEWLRFLRAEQKFAGIDQLREQIARDKEQAEHYFAGIRSS